MTVEGAVVDEGVMVVIEIEEVSDPVAMQDYQLLARAQIAERGGTVVARGGRCVEGEGGGPFLVQRWPSEAAFLDWQASDDYRPLLARRNAAARLRIAVVPITPAMPHSAR